MSRIAILWAGLPGYICAALKELTDLNCQIFVSTNKPSSDAPFDEKMYSWIKDKGVLFLWDKSEDYEVNLLTALKEFKPNIILCCGWINPSYLKIVKNFKNTTISVICLDTQWKGTIRQCIGRIWFLLKFKRYFDFAFIPGERQLNSAINLGFSVSKIIFGLYAPDSKLFLQTGVNKNIPKRFIFVGRLVREKGIEVLVQAYKEYYKNTANPWPLIIVGTGPLRALLENVEGVKLLGFIQPHELPCLLNQASCMVVPSLVEPWGVQLSEGATAGLAIIATSVCGSSVNLVRSNFNGYIIEANNTDSLIGALISIHNEKDIAIFSKNSKMLATQFTPNLWAKALLRACSSKD